MKPFPQIFSLAFKYRQLAALTILGNLLFTLFNLLSLVLFIPFLQLIFNLNSTRKQVVSPIYNNNLSDLPGYLQDLYNYEMAKLVNTEPKSALLMVCIMVFGALLKKYCFFFELWGIFIEKPVSIFRNLVSVGFTSQSC